MKEDCDKPFEVNEFVGYFTWEPLLTKSWLMRGFGIRVT